MRQFFKESLLRSTAFLFFAVFVSVLGFKSFLAMPRSLLPEVNYPRVIVDVNMGFTPLQTIEWGVTSVLEKELRSVPGVRLVKSSSSRGLSVIDVYLRENEDVTLGVQRVNAKIAEARSLIPASAEISVRPITAAAFPAAEYCFTSKMKSSRELRSFVEYTVRPLIMVIPGIFDTRVFGGDTPEFSVELDPKKLANHNLTVSDVDDRLRNSNGVDFLGPIDRSDSQILAFGGRYVKSLKDIENVAVDSTLGRSVRVSGLGKVELKNEYKTKDVSLNGKECVALDVFYQSGINQSITSQQVSQKIASVIRQNPDMAFRSWDLNDFTEGATSAVLIDLLVGMFIIGLVTFVFLRNFRYSFIALLVMPIAGSLTFLVMEYLNLSINLMTLGGLTAAIGLVVDNTVIVLEMYHRRKSTGEGKSNSEILIESLSSVAKPMIYGTATIALVFTPISFLSGLSGMFFSPMATVHGTSLAISVLLALFVVPGLLLLLDKGHGKKQESLNSHQLEDDKFNKLYRQLLGRGLVKSKLVTMCFLIMPLSGIVLLPLAETGFLPMWDEGDIVVDFRAIQPVGLNGTVDKIKAIESFLKEIPEVDFFIRKVGTGLGEFNNAPYAGEIIVKLKKQRKRSVFELIQEIGEESEKRAEGFEFDLFQILPDRLNDLSGSVKPIVLFLHGQDENKLDEAAAQMKKSLTKIGGLDSVRVEEPEPANELRFDVDGGRARAIELDPTALNENIRFGLFSVDSSSVQLGPQSVAIRLRSSQQGHEKSISDTVFFTARGGLQSVGQFGKFEIIKSRTESNHIDGSPVRTITAELSGRDLGSVVKDISVLMNAFKSSDVYLELAGEFEMQQRSFKELVLAFLAGLCLIFMTSLFFSNRLSVACLLTVCSLVPPVLGLVGCVVLKIPIDVSSFSGLISVTGISVANSFMALFAIESIPGYRNGFSSAVLDGMASRLRPILMTNFAAMSGFVPIALSLGSGDEILRPFSIAIIFGLVGALYSTLVLTPIFYFHFAKPG